MNKKLDMSDINTAKGFLDDILFDAQNNGIDTGPLIDGLMLLFEAIANKDSPGLFTEDLQAHLFDWTSKHEEAFSNYLEEVKDGREHS